MTLITVAECKDYLRIQHTAEDGMLGLWLAMAMAQIEAELRRPITAASTTWLDDGVSHRAYHTTSRLVVPVTPFTVGTLAIVDTDGTTLTTTDDYAAPLTGWEGVILAKPGMTFGNGPYTLTADVGLSTAANYATVIEPLINAAALDLVADRWHRRNPAAFSESAGGGVATMYAGGNAMSASESGIPMRVKALLAPWRLIRV